MCIGVPLVVESADGLNALCRRRTGETRQVDLSLVGPQAPGTWLLVHLETARSVIDPETADQVEDALQALEAVITGANVDHLFADLIDREPQLPDFLKEPKAS